MSENITSMIDHAEDDGTEIDLVLMNLVDGLNTMQTRLESLWLITLALLESPHESTAALSTVTDLIEGYAEDAARLSAKAEALYRAEHQEG